MTRLISKVQFTTFEPGEFIDIEERDYDATAKLIEEFPWDSQRQNIVIDLTNPSITIEGKNNDFLKCATYFNQKYALHYFDEHQVLFTKSFNEINAVYSDLKKYFELAIFDTSDFKRETTSLQHNLKHFVTQDFRYELTPRSIRRYITQTSGINLLFSIMVIALFLIKQNSINPIVLSFIGLMIFLLVED